MTDTIALTIPAHYRFRGIASLVLGGIGTRLELPYERIDDLQLAVLSVLEACRDDPVSVEVEVGADAVLVSVGPLVDGAGSDPALARVLERLVDQTSVDERGERTWLTLQLTRVAPAV